MNCVVNLVWPQFAAKLPALMVRIPPFPSYWRSEKKDSSLYKNGYPLLHHIQEDKKFKDSMLNSRTFETVQIPLRSEGALFIQPIKSND